jgi:hypothetical protein
MNRSVLLHMRTHFIAEEEVVGTEKLRKEQIDLSLRYGNDPPRLHAVNDPSGGFSFSCA